MKVFRSAGAIVAFSLLATAGLTGCLDYQTVRTRSAVVEDSEEAEGGPDTGKGSPGTGATPRVNECFDAFKTYAVPAFIQYCKGCHLPGGAGEPFQIAGTASASDWSTLFNTYHTKKYITPAGATPSDSLFYSKGVEGVDHGGAAAGASGATAFSKWIDREAAGSCLPSTATTPAGGGDPTPDGDTPI